MQPPLFKAKLSAGALSRSIKVSESKAQQLIAQALEHETWAGFLLKANKETPELLDNKLSPDIANHRLGVFAENLMGLLEIHESIAEELAKAINPFTDLNPKPYRVDLKITDSHNEYDDEDNSATLNMKDLYDMAGGEDGMLDALHSMADSSPDLAFLKEFDTLGDFQDEMRISHPLNPGAYYDALKNITPWELDDTFYEEDYVFKESSFHLVSPFDSVSYPVYLVSLSASPGDSNDQMFNNIKSDIASYGGRALMLFRHPTFKELDGIIFSVIGCFYSGSDWHWTLLTADDPETQSKTLISSNYDLETPVPPKEYGVMDYEKHRADIAFLAVVAVGPDESGRIQLPKKVITSTGTGGWQSHIF